MVKKEDIMDIFAQYPEIITTYLFGSSATGRMRKGSDVDIGILLERNTPKERAMNIQLQLMAGLEDVYEKDVEVVILNDASLFLINEVLKGRPIYDRDPIKRAEFESLKRREYFDFTFHLKRYRNAFMERIKRKGLSKAYGGH